MRRVLIGFILVVSVFAVLLTVQSQAKVTTVPDFSLKDLDGKTVKLDDVLKDYDLVMVDFWFIACKPCAEYMKHFDKLEEKYGKRGFKILAINTDTAQTMGKVKPFMKGRGFQFTVLLDPKGEVTKRYQVKVQPTTLLVTKGREVIYRHQGYKKGVVDDLAEAIDEFLPEAEPEPSE